MTTIDQPLSQQLKTSATPVKDSSYSMALPNKTELMTELEDVSSYQERVSLSSRAERMARISADFFTGTIASARIPELAERLYEDGFIGGDDVQRLLGVNASKSVVADAQNVIFRYLDDNPETDASTTRSLLQVLSVIQRMDDQPTPQSLLSERQAAHFMTTFIDEQPWTSSDDALKRGFVIVDEVLQALLSIRTSTDAAKSPAALYTQVQDQLDSSVNEPDREG